MIPVYNRAELVPAAGERVLHQGHHNLEVLLVNEGSTGGTAAVLESLRRQDPRRIRVIHQPQRHPFELSGRSPGQGPGQRGCPDPGHGPGGLPLAAPLAPTSPEPWRPGAERAPDRGAAALIPQISVVMAVYGEQEALFDSLDSILGQQGVELECVLVADGPQAPATLVDLRQRAEADPRLRLICLPHGGLTRALIRGCQLARGEALARIDVGDRMEPERLSRQWRVLQDHGDCVLVTSDVAVYGPAWEPLMIKQRAQPMATPAWVNGIAPEAGLEFDVPHHGSVMIRRSAYRLAGGYRSAFYYGQDWDLWYRLAPLGTFFHCPQILYSTRLFVGGISSRRWREQQQIARLSLACYQARSRGESEAPGLRAAALIRPDVAPAGATRIRSTARNRFDPRASEGAYFIGECCRRRGDRRCIGYFLEAIRAAPWLPKAWLRLVQAGPLLAASPPQVGPIAGLQP